MCDAPQQVLQLKDVSEGDAGETQTITSDNIFGQKQLPFLLMVQP